VPGVGREGALGSGVRLEPGRARTGADAAGRQGAALSRRGVALDEHRVLGATGRELHLAPGLGAVGTGIWGRAAGHCVLRWDGGAVWGFWMRAPLVPVQRWKESERKSGEDSGIEHVFFLFQTAWYTNGGVPEKLKGLDRLSALILGPHPLLAVQTRTAFNASNASNRTARWKHTIKQPKNTAPLLLHVSPPLRSVAFHAPVVNRQNKSGKR
jgi:hypothetical protein